MTESVHITVFDILLRLLAAGFIGGLIGFERRAHHKAIGIAGMMMIAIGSATFMLLAKQLSQSDPAAISPLLQRYPPVAVISRPRHRSHVSGSRRSQQEHSVAETVPAPGWRARRNGLAPFCSRRD